MKPTFVFSAILFLCIAVAQSEQGDKRSYRVQIEELRDQIRSLTARVEQLERRSPATAPAAGTPAGVAGLEIKRVPGEKRFVAPNGVPCVSFTMKIQNTTAQDISHGAFVLLAFDADGDLITEIESESELHGTGAVRFKSLEVPAQGSITKYPYMLSQHYARLDRLVIKLK